MAIKIKFNGKNTPTKPTMVLATRSGKKIGVIDNITGFHIADNMNSPTEINFATHYVDDATSANWKEIKNFRKVWIPEYDKWFTLTYDVDESNELIKNISLTPNSEFELSNMNVHNLEINTESDILRKEYTEPTVFFNPQKPEASLLHRVLSFTMGFTIKHVDESLRNIQRTFSLDGQNVYDTFNTIAQEVQCIFVYDSGTLPDGSIERAISAYDLRSYCKNCGKRDDFSGVCPNCGSSNIEYPYGEDTTIFVDTDGLATQINLTTNTDAVKNCFRLLSGDGLMDAAIISSNPNGSQYIWYFTDEMKEDMSPELKNGLSAYDADYEYYENTYDVPIPTAKLTLYNHLVDKYLPYKDDLVKIDDIIGYAQLMNAVYDVMDFQIYLESGLLPTLDMDTTAQEQANRITPINLPSVAVANLRSASSTTVDNAVVNATKIILDTRYKAKIVSSVYDSVNHIWTGSFEVTAVSDKEDTATTDTINIPINDTYEIYARQKIEKAVAQLDKNSYSITELFDLGIEDFKDRLKKYSRAGLASILSACEGAIGVMVEMGISNPTSAALVEGGVNAYTYIYLPYVQKLRAIEAEVKTRDEEIAAIEDLYDSLMERKHIINDTLDIVNYLGQDLATELYSYKMEDDYQNNNYISDGLDNAELFKKAAEFVQIANYEIHKAATENHSISTTLNNLLTIDEFKPLVNYFSVGNWIRIKVDGEIYRVRLLSYSIDFDSIDTIQVDFSDVVGHGDTSLSDIFESAKSMAKSYESIKYQAATSVQTKEQVNDWIKKGLDLTTMRILNATNQTMVLDDTGMSMKQWDDIEQDYSDFQSKWINTTLAFTTDNWETTETALGRFDYYNPKTGQIEEGYGIIAKQLIGNMILGEDMSIFSENGDVTIDKNGITITSNGDDDVNSNTFTIQKKTSDGQGGFNIEKQVYIDENGNLVFNGSSITMTTGKTFDETIADIQSQIDGTIETWNGSVVPTLTNEPAVNWRTDETKNRHLGDMYYVQSSDEYNGFAYRFSLINGQYQWYLIEDSSAAKAIADAAEALSKVNDLSGRAITSDVLYYLATNLDSGVTTSTPGWTTDASQAVISETNKYLWMYHLYTYGYGDSATQTSTTPIIVGTYGTSGTSGVGISSIVEKYAISNSSSSAPSDSEFTTTIPVMTPTDKYLWNYEIVNYSNGSIAPTGKRVIGVYGESGTDGRGIVSITNYYLATSQSSGVTKDTSGWTETIQNITPTNKYLWNYEEITYTTGNPSSTNPCIIGAYGNQGQAAVRRYLESDYYAVVRGNDGTNSPNRLVFHAYQKVGDNAPTDYVGRFTIETYNAESDSDRIYTFTQDDSTVTFNIQESLTYIKCSLYEAGGTTVLLDSQTIPVVADGTDSRVAILTNDSHMFAGGYTSAEVDSVTFDVIGYQGSTRVNTTVGTITGTIEGALTATVNYNGTTRTSITVSTTENLTQQTGFLTIPVTVGGVTINKIFSWSVIYMENSITEDIPLYISSDMTTPPSKPVVAVTETGNVANKWTQGRPLWTDVYCHLYMCHQLKYSDGHYEWTTVINDTLQEHFYQYDSSVQTLITNSSIQNIVNGKYTNHLDYLDDSLGDTGLSWLVNYGSFLYPNDGRCYFCGFNDSGNRADVDGWVWWNKQKVNIAKGVWIYPANGMYTDVIPYNTPIYHVYRTSDSGHYDAWWDENTKSYKAVKYTANDGSHGNPFLWAFVESTDIVIATYMYGEDGVIFGGELFTPPKKGSSITGVTQSQAQVTILEQSIEAKVQQAFDDFSIGGRNIVLDTVYPASIIGTSESVVSNDSYYLSDTWRSYSDNVIDGWVTFSYDWSTSDNVTPSGSIYVGFNVPPRLPENVSGVADISTGSGHVSESFKITSADKSANFTKIRVEGRQLPDGLIVTIRNLKVEFGNKATAWTPAPEDSYRRGGEQLLLDTNTPGTIRISAVADKKIVATGSLRNTVSIREDSNYGFEMPQTNIRYLVRCLCSSSPDNNYYGIAFYDDDCGTILTAGETYTVSCYGIIGSGNTIAFGYKTDPNATDYTIIYESDVASVGWQRYSFTFVAPENTMKNGGIAFAFLVKYNAVASNEMCGFKIERGSYASEWCLADKELSSVDNMLTYPYLAHGNNEGTSDYVIQKSGITYTIHTDGSVTANGTSDIGGSYIDINRVELQPGAYSLSGCYPGGSNASYYMRLSTVSTSPIVYWYDYGTGVSLVLTEKTEMLIRICVGSGATVNNITFYPMLESGIIIHAWKSPVDNSATRIKKAEASIKINADSIESKVSEEDFNGNEIISRVNQTATTYQVDAERINLNGAVTYSSFNNEVKNDLKATKANYGLCTTSANTAAKTTTINDFLLYTGATVTVYFNNENTVANPTLNVSGTGAKPIYANGAAITSDYYWKNKDTVTFIYDGTNWVLTETSAQKAAIAAQLAADNAQQTADDANAAVTSLSATIPAINLVPSVYNREYVSGSPWTVNGLTFTVNPDGSVKVTGTATRETYFTITGYTLPELTNEQSVLFIDPNKKYRLSGCPSGGTNTSYSLCARCTADGTTPTATSGTIYTDSGSGVTVSAGFKYVHLYIVIFSGYATPSDGITFFPMFETGETTHTYVSNRGVMKTIKQTTPIYYRSTTNTIPSKPTSTTTIYSTLSDSDTNKWCKSMPDPKRNCYYFMCDMIVYTDGITSFTDVTALSTLSYSSLWCNSNDKTKIDGAQIYTGSITADKIKVNNLESISANIGGWAINGTRIEKDLTGSGGYRVGMQNTATATNGSAVFYAGTNTAAGGAIASETASNFYVRQDGYMYCKNAKIAGNITASSGNIAGWVISTNDIHKFTNYTVGTPTDSAYLKKIWGTENAGDGGWAISVQKCSYDGSTFSNYTPTFVVRNDGHLVAKSAEISGTVNATTGRFGRWVINDTEIYNQSTVTSGTSSTQYNVRLYCPSNPKADSVALQCRQRTYNGSTYGTYSNTFYINYDGYIYAANGGRLGAWNIGTGTNGALFNGMTSFTDPNHNGVYLGSNGIAFAKSSVYIKSTGEYKFGSIQSVSSSSTNDDTWVTNALFVSYGLELLADNDGNSPYIDFHREMKQPGQSGGYDYSARIINSGTNTVAFQGRHTSSGATVENCTVTAHTFSATTMIASNYNNPSDRRLKKNIVKLNANDSEDFIKGLIPSKFEYISDENSDHHHGFIYDEVDPIKKDNKWVVSRQIGTTVDDKEVYYGAVNLTEIIPDIVAVLQKELKRSDERYENAMSKIAELEDKIALMSK